MSNVVIVDSTLRDGNHTVSNRFGLDEISTMTRAMDKAHIDYIEVGYGYGIGSYNGDGPSDWEILEAATDNLSSSKIALLVFPNYATTEELEKALQYDVGMIRLATQASDVSPAKEYIELAAKKDVHVGGFMMMSHRVSTDELVKEALKLQEYGAGSITITDSAGYMEINEVRDKVSAVRNSIDKIIDIGFHCHDNLGLAIGNTITAINSGATIVDTAISGLGAGAGNTPTETLIAVLEKSGLKTNGLLSETLEAAAKLRKLTKDLGLSIANREDTLMIGYSGVYSTFMLPAKKIAAQYDVSYPDLLMEVARRQLVPGQEDQLTDIAKDLK